MNMAHELPAAVTRTGGTMVTSPEIGQVCYVSGCGIFTYEGSVLGHEKDSRFANFNGHAFQPVPGYTIKGTQFAIKRMIETPPGRDELTAALDKILTARQQTTSEIQKPEALDTKINHHGLSGLVDVLSIPVIRDERERPRADQAKNLMGCLIAYELGSTASTAERYVDFVYSQRGKNKRDWPKGLPVLPANAEQMDAIVDQLRSRRPVDDDFVQNLLNPAADESGDDKEDDASLSPAPVPPPVGVAGGATPHDETAAALERALAGGGPNPPAPAADLATQIVAARMAERRKEVWGRATAPKPAPGPKLQPSEPLVHAETPNLAAFIARSNPANRAVFQACVGTIPERDLPIVNLMIECPRETALQSLHRQIGPRMSRNITGFNVTWTPQQTQSHCYDLLDRLAERAEKTDQLAVAAPAFGLMYEKLNLKVPTHIAALIPAEAPSPPAPPRPTAHPSGRSPLSGHHDGPNLVRLSDASPAPRRPDAVCAAPVAPPPPSAANGREEEDKTVSAPKKELASGRAAIKGERPKEKPQLKSGPTPGKYAQTKTGGYLEARGLNYDEPFKDGCQIMDAINETFPKDPPSGLKIVEACKGKMVQGDFMLLTRAMLTPDVCLTNVATHLKQRTGRPFDTKSARDKYRDLIDRIADHPEYDDADHAYLKKMRVAVGLEKPEQSHKAHTTAKASVQNDTDVVPPVVQTPAASFTPIDKEVPPPSPPTVPGAQPQIQAAPEPMITGDDPLLKMSRDLFQDDATAAKIIEVCAGKMTKPEFKSLSLLMAANGPDHKPTVGEYSLEQQRHLTGLLDRVAKHQEYTPEDHIYIGRLYTHIGLESTAPAADAQDAPTADLPIPGVTSLQAAAGPTLTTPSRHRHLQPRAGMQPATLSAEFPVPPNRVLMTAHIQKHPNEPLTPAVENELARFDPNTAGAMVAEFAAANLKPFAFLVLSQAGLRPQNERVTFAQQTAETGFPEPSLRDVFRAAAEVVQYRAHKQGLHMLAANPALNLYRGDKAAPAG